MRVQLAVAVTMLCVVTSCRSQALPDSYPYRAAMYTSVSGASQALEVFPFAGRAFDIQLPFPLGPFAYDPEGRVLYGAALLDPMALMDPTRPKMPGLFRIEFNPTRATPIIGSETLGIESLAVAQGGDKIMIAGGRRGTPCSIFELVLSSGAVNHLTSASPCDLMNPLTHWYHLSVSPDGNRLTALRNHRLELIDLSRGTVAIIPGEFILGAWSPDGKWLAVQRSGADATVLLDARTLQQRRVLGATDLIWSPDSRYLLANKRMLLCGPEAASLELMDVETGARTMIASSRCLIDSTTIGWVSRRIAR